MAALNQQIVPVKICAGIESVIRHFNDKKILFIKYLIYIITTSKITHNSEKEITSKHDPISELLLWLL